ncbi:MAG TPA: hypothetical protein VHV49_05065, partial [Pseudonocardiaceae bacterium]|nr:hypothetical protein [Pseudonocardiaceae bacterium]
MGPEVDTVDEDRTDKFNGWAWPNWQLPPEGDEADRGHHRARRIGPILGPAVFLFYLIQPVYAVLTSAMPGWQVAVVLTAVGLFSASYVYVAARGQCHSNPARVLLIAWLCMFPVVLAFFLGPDMLIFLTYAVAPALMLLPPYVGFGLGFGS